MHAYLITGTNKEKAEEIIREKIKKAGGKSFEFTIDKIENTRELAEFLKLSQTENTFILIRDIENATTESINAFLKNLEEPGKNITFLLTAKSEFRVLPTILSRCQIIRAGPTVKYIHDENAENFIKGSTGERLLLIDKIKKREEASLFCENLLSYLHSLLKSENINYRKLAYYMECSENTLDAVNKNGNVSVQLTNLVVELAKETFSDSMDKANR